MAHSLKVVVAAAVLETAAWHKRVVIKRGDSGGARRWMGARPLSGAPQIPKRVPEAKMQFPLAPAKQYSMYK